MRKGYLQDLKDLHANLEEMGTLVEEAINGAMEALSTQDHEKAKLLIENDILVDDKEKEIESTCLHLLLLQNPMASDLRRISATLKIITDVERIGDHAADISEIVLLLAKIKNKSVMKKIKKMSEITSTMVSNCIESFINTDLAQAKKVLKMDDKVDQLFVEIKNEIADAVNKNKEDGMEALDLLMIAKYFERIGDHAENIGEWVVFSITGKHKNERVI